MRWWAESNLYKPPALFQLFEQFIVFIPVHGEIDGLPPATGEDDRLGNLQ